MKQVRIRVTCDPCQAWHQAEVEEGVETVPVAGSGQTLDLCPSHRTDLAPFLALVAEWGTTPERVKGRPRQQVTEAAQRLAPSNGAQAPAQPGKAPNRRGGKRARARRASSEQGAPTAAPVAVDALTCPLCSKPMANSGAVSSHLRHSHSTTVGQLYGTTCPLCGENAGTSHLARHDVAGGMPVAFLVAQAQGDPHGVLAARALALTGQ